MTTLTLALAAEMIHMAGLVDSLEEGTAMAKEAVKSGRALEKFAQIAEAQGGDPAVIWDPSSRPRTLRPIKVRAPEWAIGYVADLDALQIAHAGNRMGVGRVVKEDSVDPEAGIVLHKRPGDPVVAGEPLASFYTRKTDQSDEFKMAVRAAFTYSPEQPAPPSILIDRLGKNGWRSEQQ